jgi:hypothetical protein
MPLLAEAYADARLSTKKLDADIDRTEKKLERAVTRFQKSLDKVTLKLDTTQAIKRLRDIQISADKVKRRIAETATLNVDVDQAALAADAAAARETVDSIIGDGVDTGEQLKLPFDVDTDSVAQAGRDAAAEAQRGVDVDPPEIPFTTDDQQVNRTLGEVKADIERLVKTVKKIPLDGDPDKLNQALALVRADINRLQQETVNIPVDLDSTDEVVEIQALLAALRQLDGKTARISTEINGTPGAVGELGAVNAAKQKVDGDANINVDVNGAGEAISKLTAVAGASATATASLSGLDAPKGLANAIGGIAAAAAAIGPTVPGLLGAGVGFLAIGAGALAAVGGIAALGVALNKVALADLKDQFASVKAELITTFQPVADLIVQDVAPRFLGAFSGLIQQVAPLAEGLIGPIADSLVAFVDTFSSILTPELIAPFATGIAGFIDTFGKFLPTLAGVTQEIAGPFFDALSGLLDLLFGTAETATPLWTGALSGFADLARGLVEPLNQITRQVVGTFQRIGPAVGNIFGDLGDLLRPFIDGVLQGVELIVNAIDSIGIENLLNIVAIAGLILAPANPLVGFVGAFLFLKDAVDILGPALAALTPLITIIGQIAGQVFDDVTIAVRSIISAIDFDQVRGVLEPFLRYIQAGFRLLGSLVKVIGAQIGNAARGFQSAFNLGAFQALFVPAIQLFTALSGAVDGLADNEGLSEFQRKWGETGAQVANTLVSIALRIQQFLLTFLTQFIKPAGNALFTFADAFLTVFKGVVDFLSGPFLDGVITILRPIALVLDALPGGDNALVAGLDAARDGLDSLSDGLDGFTLDGARDAFNEGADAIAAWGQEVVGLQEKLQSGELTWEEYLKQTGLVGPTQEEVATATEEARTKLDELNESYAQGKIDANKYYKGIAEAASKTLPSAAKAFERVQELVAEGLNLEEGADLARKQIEQANKAAETAAESTASNLRKTLGSGGLGSFFTISDEEVAKAENGARKIYEAMQEYLGLGRLSEFIDAEAVEVDRALIELTDNLQRRASNIARLQQLEALGLPFVAAQLATFADQPEVLEEAINQIFAGGVNAFLGFEGQLRDASRRALASLQNLSPSLAAGLGVDFGQEAADKIDEGNLTIQQALDKLSDNIRTKAANIRRLNQLESLGFGTLAEELATLNDDPKALQAALDQLFAGGIGSIRSANARIEAEYDGLAAALEGTGPRIAEAIGFDRVAKTIEDDSVSIVEALDAARQEFFRQVLALGVVRELDTQGFSALAQKLIEVEDPEQFAQWAADVANLSDEARYLLDAQIKADTEALAGVNAEWGAFFQDKFGVIPPGLVADQETELEAAANQISTAITGFQTQLTQTLQAAFGAPLSAGPGVTVDTTAITTGATQAGSLYGQTFGAVLSEELRTAVSFAINEAFFAKPIAFDPSPQTPLIDTFTATATRVGEVFATTIAESLTTSVATVLSTVLPTVALVSGLTTSLSLANGLNVGASAVGDAMTAIVASIVDLSATLPGTLFGVGVRAADRLAVGFVTGWAVKVADVSVTIAQTLSTLNLSVGRIASGIGIEAGRRIGAGLADALGSSEVVTQVANAARGTANTIESTLTFAGFAIGDQLVAGIEVGIALRTPSLLALATQIAQAVGAVMRAALQINSPSGVGIFIGDSFVAGIVAGLDRSQPEVEQAALALRQSLEAAATAPVQLTAQVDSQVAGIGSAPVATATVTAASAVPTSDATVLRQMLAELQAQNAELRAVAARPLIGEYNVSTTKEPQSPDQLARDAAFAKALLL